MLLIKEEQDNHNINFKINNAMKKSFSLFFVWLLAMMCSAQIQVASTGNVGIGDTLTTDVKLFVNTEGDYTAGIVQQGEDDKVDIQLGGTLQILSGEILAFD